MPRTRSVCSILAAFTAAVPVAGMVVAGCGGDGGGEASPADLKPLLPPPSQLGPLEVERAYEWDNAIDFIVLGTVLPEDTAPSEAGGKMDDAGFQAAAGERLIPKGGGAPVFVDAARFDSAEGATEAQNYLHQQDLQQPCAGSCVVAPQELTISDIPGATAVHQVPTKGPVPPGRQPFEAYSVEFTDGSALFYATASGDPGDISPQAFEKGAVAFYEYARDHAD
jgi:hypothetical protein